MNQRYAFLILLQLAIYEVNAVRHTMSAVVPEESNGKLTYSEEVEIPKAGNKEVLIKIYYTAVNRMDLVQAKGLYVVPPGVSPILGVEVSGIIASIGPGCTSNLKVGDKVMALLDGGGYAQYAKCDERTVMRLLPNMDLLTSSAIPEAFMTAYQLLHLIAHVEAGEYMLIHAAASSVGQAAIQLASRKGIRLLVTTRNADKLAACLELGAEYGYVVGPDSKFASFVHNVTNGKGVQVILDPVGSSYLRDNLDSITLDGRMVLYGLLSGGVIGEDLNTNEKSGFLRKLLFKRVNILPTTLRSRSIDYKQDLIKQLVEDPDCFAAIAKQEIKVRVDKVFSLDSFRDAHELMSENKNIGKIVLSVSHSEDDNLGSTFRNDL